MEDMLYDFFINCNSICFSLSKLIEANIKHCLVPCVFALVDDDVYADHIDVELEEDQDNDSNAENQNQGNQHIDQTLNKYS